MSRQVMVRMYHRPINSDDTALFPHERVITLNPIKKVCEIGRSSKCISKGISGAYDNAWFDSPVMSRAHAKLIYNPSDSDNVVQIRDVGSMHGTFVNGEKLGDDARTLHNLDQIAFGIEVKRGSETHPACVFDIEYETLPWKKHNRYIVPDSSDEEEEAYSYSDEDMSEVDGQDQTSIENIRSSPTVAPAPRASRSINTIDLTLNDTPSPRLEPIGPVSTGPTSTGPADRWTTVMNAIAFGPNSKKSLQPPAPQSPIPDSQENTMSDDVDTNFVSVESARNVAETTYRPNFDDSDDDQEEMISELFGGMDGSDLGDASSHSENLSDIEDDDNNSQVSEAPSSPNMSSENASRSSSPDIEIVHMPMFRLDNANGPESHTRTQLQTSEEAINLSRQGSDEEGSDEELSDYESDDDQSVGLSEAANEGIQTLVKDGLLENQPVYPLQQLARPSLAELAQYSSYTPASMNPTAPQTISAWSHDRDHSPSAVAMVKSPGASNTTENSVDQISEASSKFVSKPYICAKELGEKTGKCAFFEARESNKLQFQARVEDEIEEGAHPSPITAPPRFIKFAKPLVRVQSTGKGITSEWQRLEREDDNHVHDSMDIDLPRQANYDLGNATEDEDNFEDLERLERQGNKHAHFAIDIDQSCWENNTRDKNDFKDLGSAPGMYVPADFSKRPSSMAAVWNDFTRENIPKYNPKHNPIHPYYYSTDASSTAQESPVLEKFPTRSGLRIDDIIDGSSTGKKRKADEISDDALKNEVREWASSVVVPDNSTTQAVTEVAPKQSTPQPINSALTTANINLEHRPIKRLKMKKFAEAVGYFALGGVAVSASLFTALVATAPDFL